MITGLVGVWILPENETMRTRSIRVSCKTPMIAGKKLAIIPVLRAGLGMVNSILTLVPFRLIQSTGRKMVRYTIRK